MNQTTAFNPHYVVRLFDDRLVRFARSSAEHWMTICEEIKAPKAARLRAELDAMTDLKPGQRLQFIEDIEDIEVSIEQAVNLCRNTPKWIKRHLSLAYVEAGGAEADAAGVLRLIPFTAQQNIAHEIAMLPVVKGAKVGTEENPLVPGIDLEALALEAARLEREAARLAAEEKARASTGELSSQPSGDDTQGSTPASSPTEPSPS